nr:hypothetical protein [Tanacetum cinerariifolium]
YSQRGGEGAAEAAIYRSVRLGLPSNISRVRVFGLAAEQLRGCLVELLGQAAALGGCLVELLGQAAAYRGCLVSATVHSSNLGSVCFGLPRQQPPKGGCLFSEVAEAATYKGVFV